MNPDVLLGRLLGRREAFNVIAARCSAAEADALRQIRDQKLYLKHAKDWEEFCWLYFHTHKQNVNRVIRVLAEFGPAYFDVAQLTRISPATYRAIAPAIREQSLHHKGEAIALIPENAEKIAAAVAELRRAAAPPPPPTPPEDPVSAIERECTEVLRKIEALIPKMGWKQPILAVVCSMQDRLHRLRLTI